MKNRQRDKYRDEMKERCRNDENRNLYHPKPQLPSLDSKKTKFLKVHSRRTLQDLPNELILSILKKLTIAEFCKFGTIDKKCRKIYNELKQDYLASQSPLALILPTYTKKSFHLHNVFNGISNKITLNNFQHKIYVGSSAGYIIMKHRDEHPLLFINPFTGYELKFNIPVFSAKEIVQMDRIILASGMRSKSFIFISLSMSSKRVVIYQPACNNCHVYCYGGESSVVVDIAVFKNKTYAITNQAQVREVTLSSKTLFWFKSLKIKGTPVIDSSEIRLIASDDELFMIDFVAGDHLKIYKMKSVKNGWMKVTSLGDQAIFWGEKGSIAMRKPREWSNCIYRIESSPLSTVCRLYSMDAIPFHSFSIMKNLITPLQVPYYWYYPHQCMTVETLEEN